MPAWTRFPSCRSPCLRRLMRHEPFSRSYLTWKDCFHVSIQWLQSTGAANTQKAAPLCTKTQSTPSARYWLNFVLLLVRDPPCRYCAQPLSMDDGCVVLICPLAVEQSCRPYHTHKSLLRSVRGLTNTAVSVAGKRLPQCSGWSGGSESSARRLFICNGGEQPVAQVRCPHVRGRAVPGHFIAHFVFPKCF